MSNLVHEVVALVAEEEERKHESEPNTDRGVDAACSPLLNWGRSHQVSPGAEANQAQLLTPGLSPVARALDNAAKFLAQNHSTEQLPAYSPVPKPEMIQDNALPCDTAGLAANPESPAPNTMTQGGGLAREPCDVETVLLEAGANTSTPPGDGEALPSIEAAQSIEPLAKEQTGAMAALLPSLPFRGRAASPNGVVAFFGSHRVVVKKPARTRFHTPSRTPPSTNGVNQPEYGGTPTAAWHEITSRLNQLRANLEVGPALPSQCQWGCARLFLFPHLFFFLVPLLQRGQTCLPVIFYISELHVPFRRDGKGFLIAYHVVTLSVSKCMHQEAQKHLHDPQPGRLQTPSTTRNCNRQAGSPSKSCLKAAVTSTLEEASPIQICGAGLPPTPRSTTSSASNNMAADAAESQAIEFEQSPGAPSDHSSSKSVSCSACRDRSVSSKATPISYTADNEDIDASSRRGCLISQATVSTPLQQQVCSDPECKKDN